MGEPAMRVHSWAEYLELDAASDVKLEHIDGVVVAMAGGTLEHAQLAMSVGFELRRSTEGRPCRVFSADARLRVQATGRATYPDVSVVCGEVERDPGDRNTFVNPVLLVEVLSPATELSDRTEKWFHYQQIPSLRDYLLVSQDRVQVEHYHREGGGRWTYRLVQAGDVLDIADLGVALDVDAIYRGVELPATG